MRSKLFRTLISVTIFAASCVLAYAQEGPKNGSRKGHIFVGESLSYEGKITKVLTSTIADLTFTVSNVPDSDDLLIKTEAVSKGTLLKLFRFTFLQQYESTIDAANFRILKTVKHDVQKERVRDSVADFDYGEKRVKYTETDPKDPNRPPRRIASEITDRMQDMVSAIYLLRLQELTVGKRFDISISDSGLVYTVPVLVAAREQQKTASGKVWCLRVEPEVFGKGRLIEQKGSMVLWLTDDARHTPVRAVIDYRYKIEVKLKSSTRSNQKKS